MTETELTDETSPQTANITGMSQNLIAVESFEDLPLAPEILNSLKKIGWQNPTGVQGLCLPLTLKNRHVAGFAQTGTGKTGVFLITITNAVLKAKKEAAEAGNGHTPGMSQPLAIVLVPTRELAMQISGDAQELFGTLGIKFQAVFGGTGYEKQAKSLQDGVDVIFATPGRLKDFFQKRLVRLDKCSIMVCDEADRMFDMGFIDDAEYFLSRLNEDVQKLLFSATTNDQVKELAFEYLENPEYIFVNPESITPENIDQRAIICESPDKVKVLLGLLTDEAPSRAIIFTNTKLVADWLHYKLENNGYNVDVITGDLPQSKRIALIQKIKKGDIKYLIATDVASRGLHISDVTHVINFDIPDEAANYIHRIGRTARAGAKGCAISLVCEDYGQNLEPIKDLMGDAIQLKSEWYDERYLKIEDKSGNPYKDPNFRGSAEYQEAKAQRAEERQQKRQSRGGDGDNEGDQRRPGASRGTAAGKTTDDSGQRRRRGGRDDRSSSDSRRGDQNRAEQRDKEAGSSQPRRRNNRSGKGRNQSNQNSRNNRRDQTRHNKVQAAATEPMPAPREKPSSVGGMLKSMVKSIFGIGKKKK